MLKWIVASWPVELGDAIGNFRENRVGKLAFIIIGSVFLLNGVTITENGMPIIEIVMRFSINGVSYIEKLMSIIENGTMISIIVTTISIIVTTIPITVTAMIRNGVAIPANEPAVTAVVVSEMGKGDR